MKATSKMMEAVRDICRVLWELFLSLIGFREEPTPPPYHYNVPSHYPYVKASGVSIGGAGLSANIKGCGGGNVAGGGMIRICGRCNIASVCHSTRSDCPTCKLPYAPFPFLPA